MLLGILLSDLRRRKLCTTSGDRTKGGVYISEPPSLHLGGGGGRVTLPPFLVSVKNLPRRQTPQRVLCKIVKLVLATLHSRQPETGEITA